MIKKILIQHLFQLIQFYLLKSSKFLILKTLGKLKARLRSWKLLARSKFKILFPVNKQRKKLKNKFNNKKQDK